MSPLSQLPVLQKRDRRRERAADRADPPELPAGALAVAAVALGDVAPHARPGARLLAARHRRDALEERVLPVQEQEGLRRRQRHRAHRRGRHLLQEIFLRKR